MIKPWHMLIASVVVLVLVASYVPQSNCPTPVESVVETPYIQEYEQDDWDLAKYTDFSLIHRLDLNGRLTYEVTYHGHDIHEDLLALWRTFSGLHEGEIIILVQSSSNQELITFICEKGEVIRIK